MALTTSGPKRLVEHSGAKLSRPWLHVATLLGVALVLPVVAQPQAASSAQAIATRGKEPGVPACASCHGVRGEGGGAFPRLAGTGQAYLRSQLEAFAADSRKNPLMQDFAKRLTAAERADLASYYSRLPAPAMGAPRAAAASTDKGALIATRGRWSDDLPACSQCHGPDGSGVGAQIPPLAGLPAPYISEQLQAWRAGTRPPGPLALMPAVAQKLTTDEIAAVASYYAQQSVSTSANAASAPASGGRR